MLCAIPITLEKVTTIINIKEPNYTTYQTLYNQHLESLSCPCSTISIEQSLFIDIKPIFHIACSSDFVSTAFLNYALNATLVPNWYGYSRFQFIQSLCSLSNSSITENLAIFNKTRFVSGEVLSQEIFNKKAKFIIDNDIQAIISSFTLSYSFIRDIIYGNKLMSGFATNIALILVPTSWGTYAPIYETAIYPGPCDCLVDSCIMPVTIAPPNSGTSFTIPGFYMGCYVVDSTLKSDLQCFFDLNCTMLYLSIYNSTLKFNMSALNRLSTSFPISTPINTLFENLFVEKWITNATHVEYYKQCKPSSCSYTVETDYSLLTVLTMTLGLVGGIRIVLQFIVPKIVWLLYKWYSSNHPGRNDTSITGKV